MTSGLTLRRLRDSEWEAFRELRLASLRTDPLAFGSTVEKESAYPIAKWQDWCRRGASSESEATFVAVDLSGRLVGMVGAFTKDETPQVWGMWVHPTWRRQGVAKQLMRALLDWIDQLAEKSSTVLDVNPSQESAVRLYTSLGFAFTGLEEPLGHDPPAVCRQMVQCRPARSRPRSDSLLT